MLLSDIDFSALTDCTDPNRWGAGTSQDRRMFRSTDRYYKVWGERFVAQTVAAVGGKFVPVRNLKLLHGFDTGLFLPELSGALEEFIYDSTGIVRGYVTMRGKHPTFVPDDFVDLLFGATLNSGWVFSDLKIGNVIKIGETHSLIDFDTHLSSLADFDIEFERKSGSLRDHVVSRYKDRLLDHIENCKQ